MGQRRSRAILGLLAALWTPLAGEAGVSDGERDGGRISAALAYDWSEGDYEGERTTRIHYGSLRLAYLTPEIGWTRGLYDWIAFRVELAALGIDGPAVLRRADAAAGRPDTESSRGLGDVRLGASYGFQLARPGLWPYVELGVEGKAPTADEDEGLGTGEWDATVEVAVSRSFGGFTPFALGARRFQGDPPGLDLNDRWLASAGAMQQLLAGFALGLYYDYREAPSDSTRDGHALVGSLSWSGGGLRLSPYGLVGLSEGSPDFALGAELRADFDLRF